MSSARREANLAEARALRSEGLKLREIGERMGVPLSTVQSWLSDPDGSRLRARKDSYRGICEWCGGPTSGCNGAAKAPTCCQECREWSREDVLLAIREWVAEHGSRPRVIDLNGAKSASRRHFGSWNGALLAAGVGVNHDTRPETQEQLERLITAGYSLAEAGRRVGISGGCAAARLRYRGLSVAALRRAA